MGEPDEKCRYITEHNVFGPGDICCYRDVWKNGLCVWHAKIDDKPIDELEKSRLDRHERLDGAILRSIDLGDAISFEGCNLTDSDLSGSDFTGASLRNSSLVMAELTKTCLNNADLSGADLTLTSFEDSKLTSVSLNDATLTLSSLKRTDLTDANFVEATFNNAVLEQSNLTRTNFFGAELSNARLYGAVIDGAQVSRSTTFGEPYKLDCQYESPTDDDGDDPTGWDKARWTSRQLKRLSQDNALPDRAREHFVERKEIRRAEHRELGNWFKWLKATGSRYVMRYGEGPKNVVYTSLALVGLFGLLYPLAGGIDETPTGEGTVNHAIDLNPIPDLVGPLPDAVVALLTSFYFSFVTFTTLGYGDIRPATGATQVLATIESFVGALLMALLVFVLGRRTTW